MLITKLKPREDLESLVPGRVFLILCRGCAEIGFPEAESDTLIQSLLDGNRLAGTLVTDYICNPDHLQTRLMRRQPMLEEADAVLVLSCGVGVQTTAELLDGRRVYAGCDTIRLPGFQGVTPLEYDCDQCGQCYLNLTGGICPVTACAKSLLNGPCGGAKDGRCEVDPDLECGWERILRRLKAAGRLDVLHCPVQIRNYYDRQDDTKGQPG